jgi:hypothetical protein
MVAMVDHDYLEGLEANKTMVNRTIMYSNDTFGNISMTTTLKPPGDEMCPELAKKDRKVIFMFYLSVDKIYVLVIIKCLEQFL